MGTRNKWGHTIHKYIRVESRNGTKIWRCILPNCKHYLVGRMVLGQLSLCNRCGKEIFQMLPSHLGSIKPHCLSCTRPYNQKGQPKKKKSDITTIVDNLSELLNLE